MSNNCLTVWAQNVFAMIENPHASGLLESDFVEIIVQRNQANAPPVRQNRESL